jgi:hypothetical protein
MLDRNKLANEIAAIGIARMQDLLGYCLPPDRVNITPNGWSPPRWEERKHPRPRQRLLRPSCGRSWELFEPSRNAREHSVQARSDRRHGHNDDDRNSGSNQRIFNGCCALGVFQKPSKHGHVPAVRRQIHPAGLWFL